MKSFILSLFLVVTTFSLSAQLESTDGAFLTIEKDTLDYGTIQKSSNGERFISVKNTGKKPLIITNCDGSCGCTVPTCPQTAIAPGESSQIKIKYDTSRVGTFNKTVTIKSNAVNHKVYLKVIGTVEP